MRLGDPETCGQLVAAESLRRPANALNIEIGFPAPRCRLKLPEHWRGTGASSLRWLGSGGSPLVFGLCSPGACPSVFGAARDAIESGLILHAAHPNFGGAVTLGPYHAAVGGGPFAMISHGCSVDVDLEFETSTAAVRAFEFQIGRANLAIAVTAALEKAA